MLSSILSRITRGLPLFFGTLGMLFFGIAGMLMRRSVGSDVAQLVGLVVSALLILSGLWGVVPEKMRARYYALLL